MEYYKNLLINNKKSKSPIVFGIVMSLFALSWLIAQILRKNTINTFDWVFFGTFAFNGVINALRGMGYRFEKLFGESFIKINDDFISFKTNAFQPENKAQWSDIKSIEYKPTRFRFSKKDDSEQRLCMKKLDFELIQELKSNVVEIAKHKEIPYVSM